MGRVDKIRLGVIWVMTNAVESSRLALIRPGLRPAHLPPQGKAIGKPCVAYVENYRSKNHNVA